MKKGTTKMEQVLELTKKLGVVRPKDLLTKGIAAEYLKRLRNKGLLVRQGRGLYTLPDTDFAGHESLTQACKRVPNGVLCLLSALSFHEITTQAPFEIWMAIPNKARSRQITNLPLRIVRFSNEAMSTGIETHTIKGTTLKVYAPAKTVADCFKYRHKIGLDVAIEALQECWRAKKCTMDELWKYAKICRVSHVIKPYMEMLT
jgi:predicted transcriptional regulator of viral defense system